MYEKKTYIKYKSSIVIFLRLSVVKKNKKIVTKTQYNRKCMLSRVNVRAGTRYTIYIKYLMYTLLQEKKVHIYCDLLCIIYTYIKKLWRLIQKVKHSEYPRNAPCSKSKMAMSKNLCYRREKSHQWGLKLESVINSDQICI